MEIGLVRNGVRAAVVLAAMALFAMATPATAQCENGFNFPGVNESSRTPDQPVEVTADSKGNISVLSGVFPNPATREVVQFGQRVATVVPFRFDKDKTATLVIETESLTSDVLRWFTIERDSTTCAFSERISLSPGTNKFNFNALNATVPDMFVGFSAGAYRIEVTAPFKGGVEYRLTFYAQGERGVTQQTQTFRVLPGGEAPPDPVEPDPDLKILPLGADPATGCVGDELSNISAAHRAEAVARRQFAGLNAIYEAATTNGVDVNKLKKVKVTPRDVEMFAEFIELSKRHLECAKELVAANDAIGADIKAQVIVQLDRAIGRDDDALAALDVPILERGARKDLELLARMAQGNLSLGSALDIKVEAARILDGAYTPPTLDAGLAAEAEFADVARLADGLQGQIEERLTDLKERLDRLRAAGNVQGAEGIRIAAASNAALICRQFTEQSILGDLNTLVVAVAAERRKQELEKKLTRTKPPKVEAKAVKSVEATAQAVRATVKSTTKIATKAVTIGSGPSVSRRKQKDFDRTLGGGSRRLQGKKGLAGVAAKKKLIEDLLRDL